MSRQTGKYLNFKHVVGIVAAAALPATGLLIAVSAEQAANAAEIAGKTGFEEAFSPYELAENQPIISPAERLEAELLSSSAPREAEQPSGIMESLGTGNASYYGRRFAGRPTASGETFNPSKMTAAHRTLPFGSKVKVTNRRNGKSIVVRINDRGPFHGNRVIDLSRGAAERIGLVRQGTGPVELALLAR